MNISKHVRMLCGAILIYAGMAHGIFSSSSLAAPPEAPTPEAPAAEVSASDADAAIREESIYIPYEKLREVFEREGRGVFLPYDKFMELWQAARDNTTPAMPAGPPVQALIVESDNDATVMRDVVRVRAKLRVELFEDGWREIPLRLGDAAIARATIDGKPATVVHDDARGYALLYKKEKGGPDAIEVELEYAKAITKTPGQNSVAFQTPRAPVSKWRVTVPESQVKVNIQPLIAATTPGIGGDAAEDAGDAGNADAKNSGSETSGGGTVLLAFVGAAPTVQLDWTPKAEGATGLAALVNAKMQQQVWVEENVTRVRAELTYDISRAALSQLVVEAPADLKVTNVVDANVRQWSVDAVEGGQRITAQLFEPARGGQSLLIEMERFTQEKDRQSVDVPAIRAVDVSRQQGVVLVRISPTLRAEVTRSTGLMQIDAADLTSRNSKLEPGLDLAYRYAALPFTLQLAVEKVQPRITVDTLVDAYLQLDQLKLDAAMFCDVQRAGVFQFDVDIPAGFEVASVTGRDLANNRDLAIDGHHLDPDAKNRLRINLSRRALGRVCLNLTLTRTLNEPDLLTPTGKAVALDLTVPRAVGDAIERQQGRMIVHAPEALRIQPGELAGLRSVSVGEALAGLDLPQRNNAGDLRPVLAYAYGQDAVDLKLDATRRQPYVVIAQLLKMQVEPGVVNYEATFFYNIRYSGVRSLRIDVPEPLASVIRRQTPGVSESVMAPQPDDVPAGYVAWKLVGERDFFGQGQVRFAWEQKLDKLDVGKSVDLPAPRLIPQGADRAWGQVVLVKSETIDLQPASEPKGMRRIDPQADLMPGASVKNAAQAFEFNGPWTLAIKATQYELEEVKRTSIERALVRLVLTRGDQISAQAIYRLRSARQRLSVRFPAGVSFDNEPLRINGRVVMLERGAAGEYFIPLTGVSMDQPALIELRYTQTADGDKLTPPWFPEEPAVQQVYLSVHAPQEQLLLGSRGAWTDENRWRLNDDLDAVARPAFRERELIRWASEGVSGVQPDNLYKGLPIDGATYLFSALSPKPDAPLRLVLMRGVYLHAAVFIALLLAGVVLLRFSSAVRWTAVGVLLAALVLLGVFLPVLAMQLLDVTLVAALAIVLILWAVWHFAVTRRRDPLVLAKREAQLAEAQARKHAALHRVVAAEASSSTSSTSEEHDHA